MLERIYHVKEVELWQRPYNTKLPYFVKVAGRIKAEIDNLAEAYRIYNSFAAQVSR